MNKILSLLEKLLNLIAVENGRISFLQYYFPMIDHASAEGPIPNNIWTAQTGLITKNLKSKDKGMLTWLKMNKMYSKKFSKN